jgi:tripartite-type tricarboxylate transporter receptor subunit TctC
VDFQVVPFNGSAAVLTALRGGQVDAAVEILGPMMSQIAAKTVRPLGGAEAPQRATGAGGTCLTVADSRRQGLRRIASWERDSRRPRARRRR